MKRIAKSVTCGLLLLVGCSPPAAKKDQPLSVPNRISPLVFDGMAAKNNALWGPVQAMTYKAEGPGPIITLQADGQLFLNGQSTNPSELALRFRAITGEKGNTVPVFLWADKTVTVSNVMPLLEAMDGYLLRLRLGGVDNQGKPVFREAQLFPLENLTEAEQRACLVLSSDSEGDIKTIVDWASESLQELKAITISKKREQKD